MKIGRKRERREAKSRPNTQWIVFLLWGEREKKEATATVHFFFLWEEEGELYTVPFT